MQVVIQVIRKTFVFMFLLFFFLEVIYMVFLTLLYRVPLSKNRENIIEALNKNAEEITNSFTELIRRKYNQVQTELLLFKQHMNFMYNTLNPTILGTFQELYLKRYLKYWKKNQNNVFMSGKDFPSWFLK